MIGKVSATEKSPTTNDTFIFWLEDNAEVKPFDIIKAANHINGKKSTTFALVQDIFHVTDSIGHISNYISSDFGDLSSEPSTKRLGVTYATATVISNDKDVYMPIKDGSPVSFANEEEICKALGLDKIKNPIPAGFIEGTAGISVPVNLNSSFLIGPEGAHLNISGISGLATKTSYAMFLLQAAQQTIDDLAIIVMNVKGDDLLRIDEPSEMISESQKSLWEKTGLNCKPFDNVTYYYPFKNNAESCYSNTSLSKSALQEQVARNTAKSFIYSFDHDKSSIDLLFSNVDDPTFTMESIISHILESYEFQDINWDEFKERLGEYTKTKDQKTKKTNSDITVQSWRKFRRLINKSINNQIFQSERSADKNKRNVFISDEIKAIRKGNVKVIDIAKLDEQLQCLVFGDVLKAVNELKFGDTDRAESDIPSRIIIFVDELNKYAASNAPKNSPILQHLLDITERGRSEGITLFSAEQFKSAIHDRVKGNCSTHVYGRTNAIEISKPDYRYIPKVFANMMTRLDKGELIIEHSVFASPLKISFPMPSYYQRGKDEE